MAEYITVVDATGADLKISADDVGGSIWQQRQKAAYGPDGSSSDVSKTNGLPVQKAQPSTKSAITTVAYSTFTGSFANLSITGASGSTRCWIWNDTDAAIGISLDGGTTLHNVIPPKSNGYIDVLSSTTAIWGKYMSAPSAGNVYFGPEI